LKTIDQQRFDAVLLDILMPEVDGIEVLKKIRASRSQTDLPVIMVSAQSANSDVRLALHLRPTIGYQANRPSRRLDQAAAHA
jgi:two-component system, OmpR family, alkaline phosphatase synthesis response regulator PhoP